MKRQIILKEQFYDVIIKLTSITPNDSELGANIRKLILDSKNKIKKVSK